MGIRMLVVQRKKHGICVANIWYAEERSKLKGIIQYYASMVPIGKNAEESFTLLSDLRESEEEMVAHFSKSCKYKVNRAVREGVTWEIKDAAQITDDDLQKFLKFFLEFRESKGFEEADDRKILRDMKALRDVGALSMSVALVNGTAIVYHTHVVEHKYARLYQSASLYRVDDSIPPNVVGMANRRLHKEDMLHFKQNGQQFYDWGGAGLGEDVASITEFKESFGGERVRFYHCYEVVGIKAKLARALIGLKSR